MVKMVAIPIAHPTPEFYTKFMTKPTILCVDDEIDNLQALERLFRSKYKVQLAQSGKEALKWLSQDQGPVSVIITDQRMPEMTGVEFLSKTLDSRPDSTRILLTGYSDMDSIVQAVNSGQIYRYITKPWDPMDLINTVEKAVEQYQLKVDLKEKNIQLKNALDELKTLDQAKNQFMILINHELKTPLTGIKSYCDLLSESNLDEEQSLFVSRIKQNYERLQSLIDDSLLIVSAETKMLKPNIEPFLLSEIKTSLHNEISPFIEKKQQHLAFKLDENKKIVGEKNLIKKVLLKLLMNAHKFGSHQSEILIDLHMKLPHRAEISVYNEGSSINTELVDKILKPFYIDEDIMKHSSGQGLGLTVCQSILKSHNSQLHIENKGNGVRVSFEIAVI